MMHLLLFLQVASTCLMVGVILFVQVVHYPLFSRVGREEFVVYEQEHQRLTTFLVAPLMMVELVTALALLWYRPAGVDLWMVMLGIALLAVIWMSTWLVQVPQHAALATGFQREVQRLLVVGNWWRTVAWSFRGVLVFAMMWQSLRAAV